LPEKMKMEHGPKYLHVEVAGVFNLQRAKVFTDEIKKVCAESGQSKALVDARKVEGKISILDRYELGKYITHVRDTVTRIALVGPEEQMLSDKFLENVTNNLGVRTLVTTDIDEAIQWLGDSGQIADTDEKNIWRKTL
jgi:hypothetical protein